MNSFSHKVGANGDIFPDWLGSMSPDMVTDHVQVSHEWDSLSPANMNVQTADFRILEEISRHADHLDVQNGEHLSKIVHSPSELYAMPARNCPNFRAEVFLPTSNQEGNIPSEACTKAESSGCSQHGHQDHVRGTCQDCSSNHLLVDDVLIGGNVLAEDCKTHISKKKRKQATTGAVTGSRFSLLKSQTVFTIELLFVNTVCVCLHEFRIIV